MNDAWFQCVACGAVYRALLRACPLCEAKMVVPVTARQLAYRPEVMARATIKALLNA